MADDWFTLDKAAKHLGVSTRTLRRFRQVTVPAPLQGRVTATTRVISWGVGSLGAVAGGVLGEAIGVRPTVLIAGVGTLFSLLWLFLAAPVDWQPSTQLSN
ncbi:MAG: hypothetical protein ACRDFS_01070 [Chloroflexota bacterium]